MANNIMILTPLISGTVIAPCELPYPRLVAGVGCDGLGVREMRINVSRATLQKNFLKKFYHKFEFVLLLDSDVVIEPWIVDKLLGAWKQGLVPCANTKSGAFNQANPCHGPVTSCALIHRADYEKMDYLENLCECQCIKLGRKFKTFYVDDCRGYETKY